MLCVHGSPLYQWDRNRQIKIDSVDIGSNFEIHCCYKDDPTSYVVTPIVEGVVLLANIPNILLQRNGFLRVYVVVDGDTIYDQSFYVMARQRPNDYVYTETEVLSYSALEKRIAKLEEGGGNAGGGGNGADGKDGSTPYIQDGYWYIDGVNTNVKAQGVDGKDGKDGNDGVDGHTPIKGTDYWTEADKEQMVSDVISALPVYNGEVAIV